MSATICPLCGEMVVFSFEHICRGDGPTARSGNLDVPDPVIWSRVPDGQEVGAPSVLPTDAAARKAIPLMTGCLDYFPAALAEVAKVSKIGNDQHNPGEPIHWARGKSTDEADTIVRHLMERGSIDTDGTRHTAKAAWRVLALLQKELEDAGLAPLSRGSWPAGKTSP